MIVWTSERVIDIPQWSQRFSVVPTGSVSGVFPRALMTYLVYVYGFDWFVHV